MVSAPARRVLVRQWVDKGLSERRALSVVRMSASALRYEPRPDRNVELRDRILVLAHLLHDTVVDDEDVQKKLGLPVLGLIPEV